VWRKWWWGVDEKTIHFRIGDRSGFLCPLIAILAFASAVSASRAGASSPVATQGAEARTLAMERSTYSLVFVSGSDAGGSTRWKLDAGEWTLFEIDGLAVRACAAEVLRGGWGAIAAVGVLSCPVGTWSVLEGSVLGAARDDIGLCAGASLETIALDGCRKEARASLFLEAAVRFSPALVVCTRVDGIRIAGDVRAGGDARVCAAAFPGGSLCAVAGLAVSRSGDVRCDASSRLRLGRRVRASLGYEDGTGAINGALSIGVRSLVLDAGATVHPVLGVSKAFFVSWRRGLWE